MEDDLNILANGRRHPYLGKWKTTSTFLSIEDDLNFYKWKTTSVCFVNERRPQFLFNGRRPQLFYKWKTTSIVLQMKDNLKCVCKWKMTSDSLLELRSYLRLALLESQCQSPFSEAMRSRPGLLDSLQRDSSSI